MLSRLLDAIANNFIWEKREFHDSDRSMRLGRDTVFGSSLAVRAGRDKAGRRSAAVAARKSPDSSGNRAKCQQKLQIKLPYRKRAAWPENWPNTWNYKSCCNTKPVSLPSCFSSFCAFVCAKTRWCQRASGANFLLILSWWDSLRYLLLKCNLMFISSYWVF